MPGTGFSSGMRRARGPCGWRDASCALTPPCWAVLAGNVPQDPILAPG